MIYADDEFYNDEYLLGRMPTIKAGFEFYARNASKVLNQYTYNRLSTMSEDQIPDEIRMCCCELAELEYIYEKHRDETGSKTSESIGTYSVTFNSPQDSANAGIQEQRRIVMKWLANTGLCYQGVD